MVSEDVPGRGEESRVCKSVRRVWSSDRVQACGDTGLDVGDMVGSGDGGRGSQSGMDSDGSGRYVMTGGGGVC